MSSADAATQASILADIHSKQELSRQQSQRERSEADAAKERPIASNRKKLTAENGFGADYHVEFLARHPILTYKQVEEQFGIRIAGFGRGINRTESSIILISSIDKKRSGFVYHDHWTADGDYIYSGEGKTGDQKITAGNQAILDAEKDGRPIHLFVKFSPKEYCYQGVFSMMECRYEQCTDESGHERREYRFRLRRQPAMSSYGILPSHKKIE